MPIPDNSALLQDEHRHAASALALAIKNHSRPAFEELYSNYAGALNGVITRSIGDLQASEEILNNVFIKVWLHIGRYDDAKSSLFTWMLAICRNEIVDYCRSRQRRQWRATT